MNFLNELGLDAGSIVIVGIVLILVLILILGCYCGEILCFASQQTIESTAGWEPCCQCQLMDMGEMANVDGCCSTCGKYRV